MRAFELPTNVFTSWNILGTLANARRPVINFITIN